MSLVATTIVEAMKKDMMQHFDTLLDENVG
jgi:hypothetical protein